MYTRTKSREAGIASPAEGDVNEVRMMEKENFSDDDLHCKCLQGHRKFTGKTCENQMLV